LGPDHADTLTTMNNLAIMYFSLSRPADGVRLFEQTLALRKAKLGADHPDTFQSMSNLAAGYSSLGRRLDSLKLQEESLALRKAKLGPDHPDTLLSMGNVASALFAAGRGAEALPIIDECLRRASGQVVHPELIPTVADVRLKHFAKTKDATGCRATAKWWEELQRTDSASLYMAACMRAVTAAVVKLDSKTPRSTADRLATEEADRAMIWLKQAVTKGYKDVAQIANDTALDALRTRADFRKMLAGLKRSES
jgi:hypothetical protein